ncbi:MAG: hypothetical protein QXH47_07885 [Candidatus Bathyarchaeia archaeon]
MKKAQVVFSDDGLISSDGGPYEDGVQGVRIGFSREYLFLDLMYSSRSVYIGFGDALWKDEHLRDIPPKLPSKQYGVVLAFGVPERPMDQMSVGEHLKPNFAIQLWDIHTGMPIGYIVKVSAPGYIYLGQLILNVTAPEPVPILQDEGYLDLVRINENTWLLNANIWVTLNQTTLEDRVISIEKYYVRLSFRITISMKSLI